MKYLSISKLQEGIKERNVAADRSKLIEKWSTTGLLRGLDGFKREMMAQILENQAAQCLRESVSLSTGGGGGTSSGQVQGFTSIAFPIVRRVFGGIVANELVSIQPMSLPSGLIFYIDYTYGSNVGGEAGTGLSNSSTFETYQRGQSIYNNPAGRGVQSGSLATGGMYDMVNTGYTKVHSGSLTVSGSNLNIGAYTGAAEAWAVAGVVSSTTAFSGSNARFVDFSPAIETGLSNGTLYGYSFVYIPTAAIVANIPRGDLLAVDQIGIFGFGTTNHVIEWGETYQGGKGVLNLRKLNKRGNWSGGVFTPNMFSGDHIQFVVRLSAGTVPALDTAALKLSMAIADTLSVDSSSGGTLTVPSFETDFGTSPSPAIPEIDIKIESIPITTTTRKLRARWSPEMAQDLNAYHSMDVEVELTNILSEQIALEIDKEVLQDLLQFANGANMYWSRTPGVFVNKFTGRQVNLANSLAVGPSFTGTVREWYETLIETCIDVANTIHMKTLRGSANFMVTSPLVATIMEASTLYKPKYSIDSEGQVGSPFTVGAEAIGTISNRFTIYKDPYFPANKILIGYKGGSYLETGYVYAPYVPLIITPTLYAPEDFSPRRGVMTRYGKKMVRSDFFGTVSVLGMNVI